MRARLSPHATFLPCEVRALAPTDPCFNYALKLRALQKCVCASGSGAMKNAASLVICIVLISHFFLPRTFMNSDPVEQNVISLFASSSLCLVEGRFCILCNYIHQHALQTESNMDLTSVCFLCKQGEWIICLLKFWHNNYD